MYARRVVQNSTGVWRVWRSWGNGFWNILRSWRAGIQFYPLTLVYLTAVGVVLMGESPSENVLREKAAEIAQKAS